MTSGSIPFTVTTLTAAADEVLARAGFARVPSSATGARSAKAARIYEDAYSVVCVATYETWAELSVGWVEDQANLVHLISEHFTRTDAKAWDGYLVLLTPSVIPGTERLHAISIRRNTLHLRKLLADGAELRSIDAVRGTLLPLLPLEEYDALEPRDVLDTLPPLLAQHGVDEAVAKVAIGAFRDRRPIIDAVHSFMTDNRKQ